MRKNDEMQLTLFITYNLAQCIWEIMKRIVNWLSPWLLLEEESFSVLGGLEDVLVGLKMESGDE